MMRYSDDIRAALNIGTTLTTRFWLALILLLYGAGFFVNQASFLVSPAFRALNDSVTLEWWGLVYGTAGALGMWRVVARSSKPVCAWLVNGAIFFLCLGTVMLRIWNGGNISTPSLLSTHTGLMLMAGWCLVRTEATPRDTETA